MSRITEKCFIQQGSLMKARSFLLYRVVSKNDWLSENEKSGVFQPRLFAFRHAGNRGRFSIPHINEILLEFMIWEFERCWFITKYFIKKII